MSSMLNQIVEEVKRELPARKRNVSWRSLETFGGYYAERRPFGRAVQKKGSGVSVIAELKKASPSRGDLRSEFHPVEIAESYRAGGASALSVLTEKNFFKGNISYLKEISNKIDIPLLRKDFIIDPYQVKEAKAYGADAVLLIVSITSGSQLGELIQAADEFGLEALVECYTEEEVDSLDWEQVKLFGVNNRDLNTFQVDLHRGVNLLKRAPDGIIKISESGLSSVEDLAFLNENGIDAALIGEHFMTSPNPGKALEVLLEKSRKPGPPE